MNTTEQLPSTLFNRREYQRFRPVFTLAQLQRLAYLTHPSDNEIDVSIRRIVIPLLAKIEIGAIGPSYLISEVNALKVAERKERERYENDLMTPQEQEDYEQKILGF